MSALVYISKDLSSMRRAKSSCGRCSSGRDSRQPSPGRATYLPSERGRNLSLEIDGRQSRTSRRSTSTGRDGGDKRNGRASRSAYCFVMPYANGAPAVTSPTTYKDDYRSPFSHVMTGRRDRPSTSPMPSSRSSHSFMSSPSAPSSSQKLSSLSSSKSFHSSLSRSTTPTSATPRSSLNHTQHNPRSAMTRSATVDNTFGGNKTTYMDHFSWNGYGTQV